MRVAWWCLCGLIWPIERRRQGRVNKRRKGDGIEEALFREARSTRNWLETDHIHIIICMNRSREVQPMRHFLQFQASSVQMGYVSHSTARLGSAIKSNLVHRWKISAPLWKVHRVVSIKAILNNISIDSTLQWSSSKGRKNCKQCAGSPSTYMNISYMWQTFVLNYLSSHPTLKNMQLNIVGCPQACMIICTSSEENAVEILPSSVQSRYLLWLSITNVICAIFSYGGYV